MPVVQLQRIRVSCLTLAAAVLAVSPASMDAQTGSRNEVLRRRALWHASIVEPTHADSGALVRRVDAGSRAYRCRPINTGWMFQETR